MEKKDYLNRNPDVDRLFNIAINLSKQKANTSFAIDGEWGAGKSFLLDMLEERLKECQSEETNDDRFAVFHYNCWQYDYYEEPLIAIVSMMINEIERNEKLLTEKQKKKTLAILKGVGTVALSCFNKTIESKTNIDINELLENIRAVEEGKKETLESIRDFDPFWSFNQALETMRKSLKEIAKDKTIVFVVDELDRCLSQYAIKVLERLHHITENIDNFITIIAIDKKRLLHSVADAFGYDKNGEFKDSEKYLEKFIYYRVPLLTSPMGFGFKKKYETYLKQFENIENTAYVFYNAIDALFYGINIREHERLMQKAELAHMMIAKDQKKYDYTVLFMELILVVLCGRYEIKLSELNENLIDFQKKDNLSLFRYELRNMDHNFIIFDKTKTIKSNLCKIVKWYCSYFKKMFQSNSFPIETDDIDLADNIIFLHEYYKQLTNL